MRFVLLESPFAGDVERNKKYALDCMRDCLERGEAPFASHMLYTQCLDDKVPVERQLGIDAGLRIGEFAEATVVYTDYGISEGMKYGIIRAAKKGRPVEYRRLYPEPKNLKNKMTRGQMLLL